MGPAALIGRLKGIREPDHRRRALAESLAEGDPDTWTETLAALLRRAVTTDDADTAAAVACLTQAVAEPLLPYVARKALYESARRRGHDAVARLFLEVSPPAAPKEAMAAHLKPERPLRPRGRALTLGERKALARTHERDAILLLIRDPHPEVVAILLDNPHVTEADVVRIAAARPGAPQALARIVEHLRWSARYRVRRALVLNPATPLHLAVRMTTTLRPGDLREIAGDVALPEPVRTHAAQILAAARRAGRG